MDAALATNTVLIMADSNFVNLCVDPSEYMARLKKLISEKGDSTSFFTITGRYGVQTTDQALIQIPVDDRNKTIFSQTLENSAMVFDELIVISIMPTDPFLCAAREVLTNANKTITQYRYQRK
jgi:hypothetical protein